MALTWRERIRVPPIPASWPFTAADMQRMDERPDAEFYGPPRFVTHIDDRCIAGYTQYLSDVLPATSDERPPRIVDLCSSHVSLLPPSYTTRTAHVTGIGMNARELQANDVLTAHRVQDLNADPRLKDEADESLDALVCAVSMCVAVAMSADRTGRSDYLNKPREIMGEVARTLKPGASCHFAFSNRMFATKVVGRWLRISEKERCDMVAVYLAFAGSASTARPSGLFEQIEVVTVLPPSREGDPLYVVRAMKPKSKTSATDA